MVKSVKSFVKIGSRLQIALVFCFIEISNPSPPAYLILPNVPTPRLLGPPHPSPPHPYLLVAQEY